MFHKSGTMSVRGGVINTTASTRQVVATQEELTGYQVARRDGKNAISYVGYNFAAMGVFFSAILGGGLLDELSKHTITPFLLAAALWYAVWAIKKLERKYDGK